MITTTSFEFVIPRELTPGWNEPKQLSCFVNYEHIEGFSTFVVKQIRFTDCASFVYVEDTLALYQQIRKCIESQLEPEEETGNTIIDTGSDEAYKEHMRGQNY